MEPKTDTKQMPPFPLRMPEELRQAMEQSAATNRRSVNAEIVDRLETSLNLEPLRDAKRAEILELLDGAMAEKKEVADTLEITRLRELVESKKRESELLDAMLQVMAEATARAVGFIPADVIQAHPEIRVWNQLADNVLASVGGATMELLMKLAGVDNPLDYRVKRAQHPDERPTIYEVKDSRLTLHTPTAPKNPGKKRG